MSPTDNISRAFIETMHKLAAEGADDGLNQNELNELELEEKPEEPRSNRRSALSLWFENAMKKRKEAEREAERIHGDRTRMVQ